MTFPRLSRFRLALFQIFRVTTYPASVSDWHRLTTVRDASFSFDICLTLHH
jgi:hypothetical protein